jgi:type I restriction enzyme S subunit
MQQLLSGEKRLPGFTEEWQEVRLGKLLKHVFRPVAWAPDKIFHLVSIRRRSGGLFRRDPLRGDEYQTRDLHEIHAGDFLISKRQVSHGALAMVREDFHGCHVSKEYTILENKNPDRLFMPFFDWLSRTKRMWWLTYVASNGVVIEKLIFDPKDFLKFSIKIPSTIEEQKRIVELLEACDREIGLHRRQLAAIREQKRGLMQKLLTGEVRVKV